MPIFFLTVSDGVLTVTVKDTTLFKPKVLNA